MALQLTLFKCVCECVDANDSRSLKVQSSSPRDLCCNNSGKIISFIGRQHM